MRYNTFNEFDFAGSEALEGMNLPTSSLGLFVFPVGKGCSLTGLPPFRDGGICVREVRRALSS